MGQFLPDRLFWARDEEADSPVNAEETAPAPNMHRH
jgi:hypothetical protein